MTVIQADGRPQARVSSAATALAIAVGALVPVQARVNGELSGRLEDGLGAATLSFFGGLLILSACALSSPGLRRGLRQLVSATRGGQVPRWYLMAGAFGACFALAQSTTALVVGVAVFTVAAVAGQTLSGVLVDAVGFGGGVRQRPDLQRSAGAALVLVAAVIAVVPQLGGAPDPARAVLPALAPLVAGLLLGLQQAMNGSTGRAARSPVAATWLSFLVGTIVLALAWAATSIAGGTGPAPLPSEWWLYSGGLLGVVFVALSAALVTRIGLLLLTLSSVAGQLIGSLAVDLAVPATGSGLSPWSVVGAVLTLLALRIAARRPSGAHATGTSRQPHL